MVFPEKMTIDTHAITIVPRYCETDQAGVVHHTVYPIWFEMGRTELLRVNGIAYKELEKAGIFFVVVDLSVKYRRPAYYDEQLTLSTACSRVTPARIEHSYVLQRQSCKTTLSEGKSTLACVDKQGKIQKIPKFMYSDQH